MFTKYFTCNAKQKTDHEAGQDKSARVQIIICYSDEYATDITDILNKTISQEAP